MQPLYSLTAMTGKTAAETRTVVIGTVELNWVLWIVLMCSFPVGVVVTAFVWIFVGQAALLALPTTMGLGVVLFYRRTSNGLRLKTYQALNDRRRAHDSTTVYLCNQPVDTSAALFRTVIRSTAPYEKRVSTAPDFPSRVNQKAS